ncbi:MULTISPECIES: DUF4097 family beta strand repeat-containing protein [Streptomyces]|uniref:DUF4097 family beta strand repeat-containing protein n=1 Tax=Streptomyces TaxID=1883 RepID=UPI0004CD22CB|nr:MULTISPECIES: DUF4097 family beta strand repeat-containing protein [Streptomyces]KOT49165.1 hypothetical protein ADK43_36655 [Streptomyces rimosus subsp. rimosus]
MTARRPARSGHRTTRTALASAALVTLAVVATGCELTGKVTESEQTYTVDGKTAKLDVSTPGGDIKVVADDTADGRVKVTERLEYGKQKPVTRHSLKDGALNLTAEDCGRSNGTCNVSYEVRVPPSVAVTLSTDGGNIGVTGVTGTVGTRTSGGNIDVRQTAGPLTAETSGGDISISDARGKQTTASTDGGMIDARFTAVPDRVDAHSGGGDVSVRLPQGRYAIDATTDGGNRNVTGSVDSASPHKIKAHSDGGDVGVTVGR